MRFARDNLENHLKGVRYGRPDEDLGALRLDRLAAGGFRLTFLLPNRESNTSVTSFLVVSFEVCFTGAAGLATTLLRPSPESTVKRPSATV